MKRVKGNPKGFKGPGWIRSLVTLLRQTIVIYYFVCYSQNRVQRFDREKGSCSLRRKMLS